MRTFRSLMLCAVVALAAGCRGDAARRAEVQDFTAVFVPADSIKLEPPARDPIGRVAWVLPVGGRLVLGDRTTGDLKVFDRAGKLDTVVGRQGPGPGEYYSPRVGAVLTDGGLAVGDDALNRVTIYDSTLRRQGEFTYPGFIIGIAAAPNGNVAVLALRVADQDIASYDIVHLYDRSGKLLHTGGCSAPTPTRVMERNALGYSGALVGPVVMWTVMAENAARACDPATGRQERFTVGDSIYVPPTFPERPYSIERGQVWMSSQMWVNKIVGVDSERYIVRFAVFGNDGTPEHRYVLADRSGRTLRMTRPTDLWIEHVRGGDVYATRRLEDGDVWLLRLKLR